MEEHESLPMHSFSNTQNLISFLPQRSLIVLLHLPILHLQLKHLLAKILIKTKQLVTKLDRNVELLDFTEKLEAACVGAMQSGK
ncbi:hypothetical protein I3842_05G171700 [Carya illinoinensis]|uniref:Uncharacterized protein n=1 Tax=Carya illinoinensis TaxID=32201 RepID=A0A922JME5_CARIL|nr:hypothetical protein I3842_05G171700 [Carya illinoinensis]KAG6713797.1 hypothetical protein I3842_05G171700 [Carya illinoinensis]